MATDQDDSDVPETGGVFTFGKSKFADNVPSKFWIRNDRVVQVACGDEHTALVAESGRIFTFGANDWGQLGLGNTKGMTKPSCIKSLKHEKVRLVACGRSHSLVATESGKLFGFGANGENQLGVEGMPSSNVPVHIDSLEPQQWKMLAAGTGHCAALSANGDLYVWGAGTEGQLGLGDDEEVTKPTRLSFDSDVVCVSCGYYHTAVVTADGCLYTFGENENSKLGLGDDSLAQVDEPNQVSSISEKVVWAACGGGHTVAITAKGKVYTFGDGQQGQLGHGTILLQQNTPKAVEKLRDMKAVSAACGENHTAIITDKGHLYTFGDGRHGKLGLGEENFANQFKAFKVTRFNKFNVDKVSCGGCHMLVLALKKVENGEIESSEEDEDPLKASFANTLKGRDELDFSASISARDRRRQNDKKSPLAPLNRTLPPLTSNKHALSPLSSTLPAPGKENPLNKGRLPHIHHEDINSKKKVEDSEEDEEDEDSEVSVTPEGDTDEDEDTLNRTLRFRAKEKSKERERVGKQKEKEKVKKEKEVPKPAPRRKQKVEESEEEEEEDEEDEEEEEYTTKKKEEIKQKNAKNKKKQVEEEDEEDEDDEEEDDKAKKKKGDKKKDKDDKKTTKAKKEPEKKKTGGFSLFGRKKPVESEEEEEEEEEEKPKTKDKKKDKKKKKEDEEEDEKEEKGKKNKKDKKKDKKSKKNDDEEDEEDEEEEEEEDEEDEKKENSKKNKDGKEDSKKDKDSKKDEKENPPKKSRTCIIL